jgi:hypothetical protein
VGPGPKLQWWLVAPGILRVHGEPLIGSNSTSQLMKSMVRISVRVSASLAAGFAFLFTTGWICPRFFPLQHSLQ